LIGAENSNPPIKTKEIDIINKIKMDVFFPFLFILSFETETNPISKTILSKL